MGTKNYEVQSGDSLGVIAQENNTTVDELMALNKQIKNKNLIYVGQDIEVPIEEEKKMPMKKEERKQTLNDIIEKSKDSKPEEVYDKPCRIIHVQKVTGPKEITIGEGATYEITKYNRDDLTNAEKKKVKWRVEVYSRCNSTDPVRVIEDCSIVSDAFKVENDKLIILKVPDFWFCCIRVYPYFSSPSIFVRKKSKVKGKIKPILIGEINHFEKYDKKKDNAKDLECGDMNNDDFKPYFLSVCNIEDESECYKKFQEFISKTDEEHFSEFQSLVEWTSIGSLETVAVELVKKVKNNKNNKKNFNPIQDVKDYSHKDLNQAVKEYDTDGNDKYQKTFFNQIAELIKKYDGNILELKNIGLVGTARYNTTWAQMSGLGIILNGTESYRIEIINYKCLEKKFIVEIDVKIYDNFGLDKNDITVTNKDEMRGHMKKFPYEFLSWFYLQRVRGYAPFRTVMEYTDIIEGEF